MTMSSPARVFPLLRKGLLGLTSASLLFTTTLTPVVAQGVPPGAMGTAAGVAANAYSAEELEAILAPVALYPDQLLSTTLMAAAFPDQVTAAAAWARANRGLRGEALENALRQIAWDPAVKSLVPFPQVLDMLAGHPDWMAQLAYAVAEQEAATFDAVQRLRRKAWLAGTLRSNSQQIVRMDGELIVIEPAAPTTVYVPVYNPTVVYGAWAYPSYPPYYFPPAYYVPGDVLATGIYFGLGALIVGSLWGWTYPRWHDRRFYVDRNRYEYFQHFHRPPPGDWGRWDRDHWRPPPRLGDGQMRPPPRFGEGHFQPGPGPGPGPGPADGRFRTPPSRPGEVRIPPGPGTGPGIGPGDGGGRYRTLPGGGEVTPPPPGDRRFRTAPRSGEGQFHAPPPSVGGGQTGPMPGPGGAPGGPPPGGPPPGGGQFRAGPEHPGGGGPAVGGSGGGAPGGSSRHDGGGGGGRGDSGDDRGGGGRGR